MVGFRISRKNEHKHLRPGRARLYKEDGEDLVRRLNAVSRLDTVDLLADMGHNCYHGRRRTGSSMDAAADSLIKVIARSLREPAEHVWFTAALAECLNVDEDPWLREAAMMVMIRHPKPGERLWYQFAFSVMLRSATQDSTKRAHTASNSHSSTNAARVSLKWPLLSCDEDYIQRSFLSNMICIDVEALAFLERRRNIQSLKAKGYLSDDRMALELRALDFLETNLVEIERELELNKIISDFSIQLAVQVFDLWVRRKLNGVRLSFRLALDRLTSTYRLVPLEACLPTR